MNFREEIQNMLRLTERMTPIESNSNNRIINWKRKFIRNFT